MSKRVRFAFRVALLVIAGAILYYRLQQANHPADSALPHASGAASSAVISGGKLTAVVRTEPKSFNRYVAAETSTKLFAMLTQGQLIRVDPVGGDLEPRLAREWTSSPDGLTWTLKLRDGVTFSDGVPFTSADVLFSFAALYDTRVGSPMASVFTINDKPLLVRALDDHTVVITFPSPYGPGLALLDSLPILPRHLLEPRLKDGTFGGAWGVTTPPAQMAGLGPFVLAEYVSGQHMRFTRNPHFWRRDDHGTSLPYLDELDIEIVPEQNAEMLRLESGQADLLNDQARPEDMAAFSQAAEKGAMRLIDAGVSLDPPTLWFNLAPGAARAKDRPWLQKDELRRAISLAVNRKTIVDTVYLGAAEPVYGPVTSGYGEWFLPDLPKTDFDPAKAKSLLASIGLTDHKGDGQLEDASGKPARFSILTRKGNTLLERGASVIQQELGKIGLGVDVTALDAGSFIAQFGKGDYDAMYYVFEHDSTDPALNLDFWMSSGSFHVWNPQQPKPATAWEAQVDDLMRKQSTAIDRAERRKLFAEVQRVFAEHLPVIAFAAPKVTIAMSPRVAGAVPVVFVPQVLWNAEMLRVAAPAKDR